MGARDLLDELRGADLTVKLIDGKIIVAPKDRLTDSLREAVRAHRAELAALLTRACTDCRNRLAPGTCGEPVAAGLAPKYMLIWPPTAHAQACPAFAEKLPGKATERPYRLSRDQGDACHAWPWDDATIARFQARAHRFARLGIGADDAEDLAERLHLRDVEGDSRSICLECGHLAGRRCGNSRAADLAAPDLPASVTVTLQRCHGFTNEGTR